MTVRTKSVTAIRGIHYCLLDSDKSNIQPPISPNSIPFFLPHKLERGRPTDQRTNRPTVQQTNGPTNGQSFSLSCVSALRVYLLTVLEKDYFLVTDTRHYTLLCRS